ncbi:MAG: class I SAM-dependent methyltransferase [Candidatus Izemoplasmatales bacterium]|jgi:16S rRNA (guanine1207-N2)-methyltransferase|nr:class I SAM-dependent methyltransferase [Candidatus Izemoplasmatales bacterium]
MSHYYSKDNDLLESRPHQIQFQINQKDYTMTSDKGVFSKAGLDFGSRVLLETILPLEANTILDLGCGYGPIGIVLKKENSSAQVTMVDINPRALMLSKKNALANYVNLEIIQSDGFENIQILFDAIVTNPPIRAGKKVIYVWFFEAKSHLNDNGALYIVIQKKQGALSAIKECERWYSKVLILEKKSGYYVIKCQK